MKPHDLTGQRFFRLVVIKRVGNDRFGKARWLCQCDCGNTMTTSANGLRKKTTKSCGCWNIELTRERAVERNRTHGQSNTVEFHKWTAARARCRDRNHPAYPNYGGRGIRVCERWNSFENFIRDMGKCPAGMTLERKDNNGDYEPGNCIWASRIAQARNKRNNRLITYSGKTMPLKVWCEQLNLPYKTMKHRFQHDWDAQRAFTTPVKKFTSTP